MSSRALSVIVLISALPAFCGCAVMKAANQPGKKNLSVFSAGVPRSHLIAEIGPPLSTQEFADGRVEDVFKFRQGYSKKVRVGRAIAHGAADLATGFMWELAGTPLEMIADGTEVKTVVQYDPQGNIESVQILEGEKAFQPSPWGFRREAVASYPAGVSPYNRNEPSNPQTLTPVSGSYSPPGETALEWKSALKRVIPDEYPHQWVAKGVRGIRIISIVGDESQETDYGSALAGEKVRFDPLRASIFFNRARQELNYGMMNMATITPEQEYYLDGAHGLSELIEAAWRQIPHLTKNNLSYELQEGDLILRGAVRSYYHKQLVQETLRNIEGIRMIRNEIQVV